jgi:nucleotide-binding universal stress UspA family protein
MKRIVCPTDFSEPAVLAERQAVRLALALGAEVVLLHVATEAALWRESVFTADLRGVFEAQRKWAQEALAQRAVALAKEGVTARGVVKVGAAWSEIVRFATDEHADMIVMGTQGRTGLEHLLLGSVAERVVRHAPCPVLTVRPNPASEGGTS